MSTPRDRKMISAAEAVEQIGDGKTVATGGFVGAGVPETLLTAIERRFLDSGKPRDLTVIYAAGQGDGQDRGINHLAHEGLVRRVIGGHWGLAPRIGQMALSGQIEAYNFPQGVVSCLFRDIAAGRPGCITPIGLGTFIDPIHDGGVLNGRTTPELIERVELGGRTWLWYKAVPVHVALIRATAADPFGNLIMHEEGLFGEVLAIAQAAHNSGGIVIAQVRELLDEPAQPQSVRVPGILVDQIVLAEEHEHPQTFGQERFNDELVTSSRSADMSDVRLDILPLDARRIIAERACDEIPNGAIANLGIGMPEGIANIAAERGWLDRFVLTVESGPIGGIPQGGLSFGVSRFPQAIIDQTAQFDFYDGRGLDFAALGAAEVDVHGNVNVSKFGPRLAGVGGFVNITQTAKRLVFCGTFTAGGLEIAVEDGKLKIVREGRIHKFVDHVEHLSFSAAHSREVGQEVLYVTERAVFRLGEDGLELIEIAPGIVPEEHLFPLMAKRPLVRSLGTMTASIF